MPKSCISYCIRILEGRKILSHYQDSNTKEIVDLYSYFKERTYYAPWLMVIKPIGVHFRIEINTSAMIMDFCQGQFS